MSPEEIQALKLHLALEGGEESREALKVLEWAHARPRLVRIEATPKEILDIPFQAYQHPVFMLRPCTKQRLPQAPNSADEFLTFHLYGGAGIYAEQVKYYGWDWIDLTWCERWEAQRRGERR